MPRTYTRTPLAERFWPKVDRDGPAPEHHAELGQCWLWTAYLLPNGYGLVWDPPDRPYVHHVALKLVGVEIPPELVIGHTCDVRRCVRTDDVGTYEVEGVLLPRWGHLFLATQLQNMADMIAKGRSARGERNGNYTHPERRQTGEANGQAKLTATEVLAIRARYDAGGVQQKTLAAEYGVSPSLVSMILGRQGWNDL